MTPITNRATQTMAAPLRGHRIVVTRAREQAGGFAARLAGLGAEVIEFPVIKLVEPEDFGPLDTAIARLEHFDWIIFTSTNAVDFFCRRLTTLNTSLSDYPALKICAIGPATTQALQARGLRADLVPARAVAESVVAAFDKVAGGRFLFPCGELARETLVEGLEERGATVERVVTYRNVMPHDADEPDYLSAAAMVQLLQAGQISLVSFTSSSTVRNFAARLATVAPSPLPGLLAGTVVACIGPVTAATARELGLNVALEPAEFNTEALAQAIVNFLAARPAN